MTIFRKSFLVGAVALAAPFADADSASITSTFTVSATVQASCTIVSNPTDVSFGAYDPTSTNPKTTQGSVTLTCTNGSPLFVWISTSGNVREMSSSGGSTLPYSLFTTSGGPTEFPSTRPTTSNYSGTGASQTITYYGQIAAGLFRAPDTYTQTATFNVEF